MGGVKRNTFCTTTFITSSDIHSEYNVMNCRENVSELSVATYGARSERFWVEMTTENVAFVCTPL